MAEVTSEVARPGEPVPGVVDPTKACPAWYVMTDRGNKDVKLSTELNKAYKRSDD